MTLFLVRPMSSTVLKDKKFWTYKYKGYIRIYTDAKINPRILRFQHDLIFEEDYKCCLLKWGIVHHKNEVKDDNRIENLQGMTNSQHISHHHLRKANKVSNYESRQCFECYSNKTWTRVLKTGYIQPCWFHAGDTDWLCGACLQRKMRFAGMKRY